MLATATTRVFAPNFAAARRVKDAEIRRYDADHFDLYIGDGFGRTVADQIEFLLRMLTPRRAGEESQPE